MIHLTPEQHVFVTERHLATLTTLRPDGTPHVVPVGFTWDTGQGLIRITTRVTSAKVRNIRASGDRPARAAVCQVEGGRWLTFEGEIEVRTEAAEVEEAVRRYATRYRQLEHDPRRVVLALTVDRIMGSSYMVR